jgi:hypothetical protein
MREINAAFQAIRHAPLRYHIEGHPRVAARATAAGREVRHESIPVSDRTEWAIRFALGVMFGAFLDFVLLPGGAELPRALWIVIPVLTGVASAHFGNAFWSWVIESLWWLDLFF